ncbi:hypothetical protein C1903_14080 [Listeria ivanovii]|uniref:hypothetical protein n=1 Tax=Listeria ivanovii TaxID=1638 RepID=UPI000DA71F60|nr:hypothetical protein [Listeria ivanovii]PZF91161.1 hypothetical protein C1905_01450 [Listeria ivanovii]PZF91717.1 hypothetical protein C1903_14080 [Listeria ivanovii]PZG03144.1 hypothetical protein C2L88_14050 [Listeria ivanovii]PZG07231.1 hypothetical protein C1901_14010 [Listeria ivanovii]PZG28774.1 hypothetical protein C1900_01455 [Listeria ivanovii]
MSEIKINKAILAQVVSKGQGILSGGAPTLSYDLKKTNIKPFESGNSTTDDYSSLAAEIFRLVRYSEQSLNMSLSLVVKTAEAMEELDKEIGNGIASKGI